VVIVPDALVVLVSVTSVPAAASLVVVTVVEVWAIAVTATKPQATANIFANVFFIVVVCFGYPMLFLVKTFDSRQRRFIRPLRHKWFAPSRLSGF
jgi:hypothetical protein